MGKHRTTPATDFCSPFIGIWGHVLFRVNVSRYVWEGNFKHGKLDGEGIIRHKVTHLGNKTR